MLSNPRLLPLSLTTHYDLSICALEAAIQLFRKHSDYDCIATLVASHESLSEDIQRWAWYNHRWLSVQVVPAEILKTPTAWALNGVDVAIVEEGCYVCSLLLTRILLISG